MADAKMTADDQCTDCLRMFVQSDTPLSANPRSRSYAIPELCNECHSCRLAKQSPPVSLADLLEQHWVIGHD